jgi:hypothetical protein
MARLSKSAASVTRIARYMLPTPMKPSDAYGAVADLLTSIIKRPYRETDLSAEEWDKSSDGVLKLAEKAKGEANGGANNRQA